MTGRGLTKELIGFVSREVAFHARREWSTSWTPGPDRAYFIRHLADAGIETQDGNVVALRAAYLQLFADLLVDAERRYRSAKSAVDELINSLRNADAMMQKCCTEGRYRRESSLSYKELWSEFLLKGTETPPIHIMTRYSS